VSRTSSLWECAFNFFAHSFPFISPPAPVKKGGNEERDRGRERWERGTEEREKEEEDSKRKKREEM